MGSLFASVEGNKWGVNLPGLARRLSIKETQELKLSKPSRSRASNALAITWSVQVDEVLLALHRLAAALSLVCPVSDVLKSPVSQCRQEA